VGNGDFAIRLLTALLSIAVIPLTGVFLWMWLPERGWVVVGDVDGKPQSFADRGSL